MSIVTLGSWTRQTKQHRSCEASVGAQYLNAESDYGVDSKSNSALRTRVGVNAPIDAGTKRVISDGCRPIFDPDGLIDRLITAIGTNG